MFRQYVEKLKHASETMGCSSSLPTENQDGKADLQATTKLPPAVRSVKAHTDPPGHVSPAPEPPTAHPSVRQVQAAGKGTPGSDGTPTTAEEKANRKAEIEKQIKQLEDIERLADETKALLEQVLSQPSITQNAIQGNLEMECPSPAKVVRIFTSSTFTDTKQERNTLMKFAYPKIKEHCRKIGYEFQVVDMRWGVRDEATDDHMGTELCIKELKLCQKLSTGPNFVSLISHKYGYTAFPRVIEAEEFEKIYANIEENETKSLFQRWYTRDDNAVPPAYILSSISTHIPDFLSHDKDKQKVARNKWYEENEQMQDALQETAKEVFDEDSARKYIMSITETETQEGLKPKEAAKHFLWLKRTIVDIEEQENSYALSRYIECQGPEAKINRARQMLKELKVDKMQSQLDPNKILNYSVHWSPTGGIDPDASEEHKKYLDSMCVDFISNMTHMIDQSIVEKKKIDTPLVEECIQHIRFCQTKCEGFAGRNETLEQLKSYMTSSTNKQPFVLHGTSGTGKTSILAMAAKMAKTWMHKSPVLVLRFLGTSPESSNLMSLLYSICQQISRAYRLPPIRRTQNIVDQIQIFKMLLTKGRPDQPLLIILDSLDQLDPAYDARNVAWLVSNLVATTKVIVSTLSEPVYQCYPALQRAIKREENLVEVPVLHSDDASTILSNWLEVRHRKLTGQQMQVIINAFKQCSTPLFLKLSFEESISWSSFSPADRTVLQSTVRSSIDHLFEKMEKLHGKILVSRALSYLTLAHNGATEAELEDVLSCDDDVLNDVYMYWTPPMRRLPPLLLVRIRTDLNQYVVEKGADGVRVLYWYHRQFIEAADARYCSDAETNTTIHSNLADFFNGTWANGKKKPYTTSTGETGEDDRHVSAQPLQFGDTEFNMRALSNLPYHRIKAGQDDLLEQQCLANVQFLLCKIQAKPLLPGSMWDAPVVSNSDRDTLDDFSTANAAFPDNALIQAIQESLLLSQKGVITDPWQLVPQLLGRLQENDVSREFIQTLRNYPRTFIEPTVRVLDQPGGQLVHCIFAHKSDMDMMDMTANGSLVITVCQEVQEVSLWDIKKAQLKRNVTGKGQCTRAVFCNNDQWIACEHDKEVIIEEVETGKTCFLVTLPSKTEQTSICVAGTNNELLLSFSRQACLVFDLTKEGQRIQTVTQPDKMKFGPMSIPYGTEHYVAVCDDDQYYITVLDLRKMTFNKKFRGFEKVLVEDGDYDEHEVEVIAIHPGETYVAYTTMFTSEVIFADFVGTRLRTIPADAGKSFRSLNFTPDGQHLFLHDENKLRIFDNTTLQEIDVIEQKKDLIGANTKDMKTVVTISQDGNLRIWDRTKRKEALSCTDGERDNNGLLRMGYISAIFPLPTSRYVAVQGTEVKDGRDRIIGVYDIIKEEYVKFRILSDIGTEDVQLSKLDSTRVLLRMNRKLHVFNLDSMAVDIILQGFTPKQKSEYLLTKSNQLVCLTKGEMNLKVYDISTGKVAYILKAGQTQKIDSFVINQTGTVALAQSDEGPLLVFDMVNRTLLYTIPSKPAYGEYFGYYKLVSNDGTRLLFSTDQTLPGMPKGNDIDHAVVWDVQKQKELFRMYDAEYEKKYQLSKSDDMTSIEGVFTLDSDRILTTNFDNVPRIYDWKTGKLLDRLEGHTSSVQIDLNVNAPYILTFSRDEDCIRIWDKTTCTQIASFSQDQAVSNVYWSACGKYFYSVTKETSKIMKWRIIYGYPQVTDVDFNSLPELFSPQVEFEPLKIDIPDYDKKNFVQEEADPDTDPEVVSSGDDDDDGDDDDFDDDCDNDDI